MLLNEKHFKRKTGVILKTSFLLIFGVSWILLPCCNSTTSDNVDTDPFAVFDKQVDVFGIKIYATPTTGDDKVLHAAAVMAEYLDNDEDGVPDNQEVIDKLVSRNATLVMFKTEQERDELFKWDRKIYENYELQDLYDEETWPGGAEQAIFDATLEEVHHLTFFAGYSKVYPDVFGAESGTSVGAAMDLARGGHFESVPDQYPENAWYSYDDVTCDYGCMIIEYLYWTHTSILGAQDFPGRLEQIDNEWRLNTLEKVKSGDPAIYSLLTDPKYKLSTVLPDGNYKHRVFEIEQMQ